MNVCGPVCGWCGRCDDEPDGPPDACAYCTDPGCDGRVCPTRMDALDAHFAPEADAHARACDLSDRRYDALSDEELDALAVAGGRT